MFHSIHLHAQVLEVVHTYYVILKSVPVLFHSLLLTIGRVLFLFVFVFVVVHFWSQCLSHSSILSTESNRTTSLISSPLNSLQYFLQWCYWKSWLSGFEISESLLKMQNLKPQSKVKPTEPHSAFWEDSTAVHQQKKAAKNGSELSFITFHTY